MTQAEQGRILGIDYGSRWVGLALSDPLRILATSYRSLQNDANLEQELGLILEREAVEAVVVGLPLGLNGKKTRKTIEVEEFILRLQASFAVEVIPWDERFTTSIARQTLLAMGTKKQERRKRDGRVDAMAAAIILQGFLDSTKKSLSC